MRAADTNVLLRLLVRDDEQQTAAAVAFVGGGVWVSTLTLADTICKLSRIYGRAPSDLHEAIKLLLNQSSVTIQDADAVSAALDLFRLRPVLGFSDCLMVSLARKAGHLPLGTFDRALGRIDGVQKL